jgi:hypothetical protein
MTVNGVNVGTGAYYNVGNTIVGNGLSINETGIDLTAIGRNALSTNKDGNANTAIGRGSFELLNSGSNNTALGSQAGGTMASGTNNTLIGYGASPSAVNDVNNEITLGNADVTTVRMGNGDLLYPNSSNLWSAESGVITSKGSILVDGNSNLGANAVASNLFTNKLYLQEFDGDTNFNISVNGVTSDMEFDNAFGGFNFNKDIEVNGVPMGAGSGTSSRRIAIGLNALGSASVGAETTAIGWGALQSTTTGSTNTGVGDSALSNLTEGSENQAFGNAALTGVTTGSYNTAIGRSAGSTLKTGANNTCIGNNAQPSSNSVNNEVTIGNDDVQTTRLKGNVIVGDSTWTGGTNNAGLAIQTTSSDGSPFAMYARNSDNDLIFSVRCDGVTSLTKVYLDEAKVDLRTELNLKDKLIDKLTERLDALELKFKALK